MYAMMLADPALPGTDLSSLRVCAVGGQTMPVAKMAEWEHRSGAPLLEIWGMTELGGAGASNCAYMPNVHASIGFALPGLEAGVAAIDDASVAVPDGDAGELMVRGPLVMRGYRQGDAPGTQNPRQLKATWGSRRAQVPDDLSLKALPQRVLCAATGAGR